MDDTRCATCQALLCGRQRRFCSRRCKNADTNHRHQNYVRQQARGLARKMEFLAMAGRRCSQCGYDRNLAALTWHHVDPGTKRFTIDLRTLSNRRLAEIREELAKCVVLCANCHAETHHPHLDLHRFLNDEARSKAGLVATA